MTDLIITLIQTLDISKEEAMQLVQFIRDDPADPEDMWVDPYETF